jgi:DNA-binding response OmpR family regulator
MQVTGSFSPLSDAVKRTTEPAMARVLLVVGDEAIATLCASTSLTAAYRLEKASTLNAALMRLSTLSAGIVITELALSDGDGVEVCRAARAMPRARLVLVSTSETARVPKALAAGCHSVLLKPFAPNLLFSRLARLGRDLQIMTARPESSSGTNRYWPDLKCTQCGRSGVTGFDAASMRRSWYACLECEHVWIAERQE